MKSYTYSIFEHSKDMVQFSKGENWLIGVDARKREELLKRLTTILVAEKITDEAIQKIITDFIVWFKESYKIKEQKDYPYPDIEIVKSVGILKIDTSQNVSMYKFGRFEFQSIKNSKLNKILGSQINLLEIDFLIANPQNIAIDTNFFLEDDSDFENKLNNVGSGIAIVKIQEQKEQKSISKTTILVFTVLLFLSCLGYLGWANREVITKFFSHEEVVAIDTTFNENLDSTYIPDSPVLEEPVNEDTVKNEPKIDTSSQVVDEENPLDYFNQAEKALYSARTYLEVGKNSKAKAQLDTAEKYYQKYLSIKPEDKKDITPKFNEINQKRKLLNSEDVL
jgi:hypothetical protein